MVTDYLAGRLIRLRALESADEPLLQAWVNDPVVTEYLTHIYPYSHAQESGFIAAASPARFAEARFGIVTLDEGVLIGVESLEGARPESRSASLAIMIGDRRYWGRGYGTDAVRTLCRFGFEMMNLHRVELEVFPENLRAIRVYERVGFQHEGRRREGIYRAGRYSDVLGMGMLRSELQ